MLQTESRKQGTDGNSTTSNMQKRISKAITCGSTRTGLRWKWKWKEWDIRGRGRERDQAARFRGQKLSPRPRPPPSLCCSVSFFFLLCILSNMEEGEKANVRTWLRTSRPRSLWRFIFFTYSLITLHRLILNNYLFSPSSSKYKILLSDKKKKDFSVWFDIFIKLWFSRSQIAK